MEKVLIDLNVLLDFLAKRDNHIAAAQVIGLCEEKKVKGYVSSHEITTLAYFLTSRYKSKDAPKKIIKDILDLFTTISITESMLRNALDSKISDYEDAVIKEAALKENVKYIITNNLPDFKKSTIKAISPSEFISMQHRH